MTLVHRRRLMNADRLDRALRRMVAQVIEHCPDTNQLALIGIRNGGVNPTIRMAQILKETEKLDVPTGLVDPTLYRDDLADGKAPLFKSTEIGFDIEGKYVVLVDDVLFTGRTLRATLDHLMDFGRPAVVRAAVLIDRREHRELPIQPDYWGQIVDTARDEEVRVTVHENKNRSDSVELITRVEPEEAEG